MYWLNMLYSHMQIHIYMYTQHHNDTINKQTSEDFFNKIYLSLYCKSSKGLCGVLLWEGAGDRTSVYECTMEIFFTSSHFISQLPPTRFPLRTAIRMCQFLPVHHLGMAFLAGSKVKIQQIEVFLKSFVFDRTLFKKQTKIKLFRKNYTKKVNNHIKCMRFLDLKT